jgi:hypothetical protein
MNRPRNPIYDKWQTYVEQWQASGLSQPKFCELNQISYTQFKYFRNRLRDIDYVQNVVAVVPQPMSPPSFEPIQIAAPPTTKLVKAKPPVSHVPELSNQTFKVTLQNGLVVDVPIDSSHASLKSLMEVLQQC